MARTTRRFEKADGIMRQIIARCHVGMSNRAVIKYAISRFKNKWKTFASLHPIERRHFMKRCIEVHAESCGLFRAVTSGRGFQI